MYKIVITDVETNEVKQSIVTDCIIGAAHLPEESKEAEDVVQSIVCIKATPITTGMVLKRLEDTSNHIMKDMMEKMVKEMLK